MDGRSPHLVLGVPEHASRDAIRRAYVAAARRTHPDLGGDAAEFRAVQAAWEALRHRAPARHRFVLATAPTGPARVIRESDPAVPRRRRADPVFADVLAGAMAAARAAAA